VTLKQPPTKVRRRRSPADARKEILAGGEQFLRTHPWHELTIDKVMACTTLSRPSFYVHFTDRLDLLVQLGAEVSATLSERSDRASWLSGQGSPYAIAREALEGLVALYAEHGTLIKAVVEASYHEDVIEAGRLEVEERFSSATASRIADEVAAGRAPACDARRLAEALTLLTEATLVRWFGGKPQVKQQQAVETLLQIWSGAIYGCTPAELKKRWPEAAAG
jgi:AcrR family transcriptional regulator